MVVRRNWLEAGVLLYQHPEKGQGFKFAFKLSLLAFIKTFQSHVSGIGCLAFAVQPRCCIACHKTAWVLYGQASRVISIG